MRSSDIRGTFLEFFRQRGARIWPSSSLIPGDPSLLLTVAGMVQFKPYFLGEATPEHPRAASVQKCARTNDIENVGLTTRHLTLFEMLGNFSFGDYFKREAISWAWELSTAAPADGGFGFDPQRIWATVYEQDDEAEQLWLQESDLPAARIVRRGAADNFWDMGAAGPCGPCSELYYDRGPEHGAEGGPAVDESRYLEFWNLVFMQFQRDAAGTILGDLPRQNVDTGMGLERMAMLLQDVPNVYETDVLRPMLDRAIELTGSAYGEAAQADVSLRVIAEHARSAAFLIADGVLPSNEARGYVLRRLLRRAVRHARTLAGDAAVMRPMMDAVITTLGDAWPDLRAQSQLILRVAAAEEDAFSRTLRTGMGMLTEAIEAAKPSGGEAREAATGAPALPAETAFILHDTYGFPVDLTVEIAAEHGLQLDRDAFAQFMEGQRTRARAAARGGGGAAGVPVEVYRAAADRTGDVEFLGYERTEADTRVGAIVAGAEVVEAAEEGDEVEVVLPRTPFYAEGGGQLGDHGTILTDSGRLDVVDTYSPVQGLIVHRARVTAGEIRGGQDAHAAVDSARRASITRGHTATHILHATLKDVLGEHAAQAGSAIDAGHFRFDFPHFEAVSRDQLAELEQHVNRRIAEGPRVETLETTQEEARRMGAMALFGEKYGERVRVVQIGDFSRELCGGTHVSTAAEVGLFAVLSEGSIAANLRRIEAATGPEAFTELAIQRRIAQEAAQLLRASPDEVVERISTLLERVKSVEKELAQERQRSLLAAAAGLLEGAESLDGIRMLAQELPGADRDALKAVGLDLRNRLDSGVVMLGTRTEEGSALLFLAVTADLAGAGVTAAELLRPGAQAVGGGAGGKGDSAQAGGKRGDKLPEAFQAVRTAVRERLTAA